MEEIAEKEFIELLYSENFSEFTDLLINFENVTNVDLNKVTLSNKFKNCKFKGERVDFMNLGVLAEFNLTHYFSFDDCEFENDIYFKDCAVQEIKFSNISKPIKNLHLAPKRLGYFTFECAESLDEKIFNEINITIHNCEIIKFLDFLHLKSTGNLIISHCKINRVKIHDSKFKRIDIDHCNFASDFQFTLNSVQNSYFKNNEFNKTNFSLTDFGIDTEFSFNDFTGTALFEKLKNENRTRVKFKSCNFMKYTYFNKSTLYDLHIDTSKFQEFTSFQELELNSIFLDRTIFEKPAFFDDIEIFRFSKCNKRTLRNIKQQLLRTDNKIDYDNFRSHELNSYKEELKKNIELKPKANRKKLRRDLTILRVNSFYSNNGTDWVKAIKRTLLVAILFYSIFYGIHNFEKEIDFSNASGYSEYFIGLFRYFLLTDFHNPLANSREYLVNVWEWIPFVFGKIFIGIGIYEILVSFRKFRK
ncbi:hypothetical protein Q4Q34_04315 [Flavivirga abyssicola]|uniref:hypothetical protein n=1 Tax=Flavivirga abyssicola TaxID=3063533 RepID=UPI0026DF2462|nr:hypothetical protein [Flavivirga sp. MEBiC07777]WVK14251.1 hypothetical protein Q4Q34_04315 [Flavivirga sp. MEBiC07777]